MKVYCVEYHTVLVYKESEISDEVLKENNIDVTDEEVMVKYIEEANDEGDLEWNTVKEDWVSHRKGGYDIDYSTEPLHE